MIFVDDLQIFGDRMFCHITSDTSKKELATFVKQLHVKPHRIHICEHFGYPHMDVGAYTRSKALSNGATAISTDEMMKKFSGLTLG